MTIALQNPQLQAFLEAEVREGNFPSIEAAVEEAVMRMKWETDEPLDDELEAKLAEAEAQIARGEFLTLEQLKTKVEALCGPQQ